MCNKIIRLRRRGVRNVLVFDIVVMFKKDRSYGRFIEKIGFLNLKGSERSFYIDIMRLGFWMNNGALLHKNLRKYLIKFVR